MTMSMVLKLDVSGQPVDWITREVAAGYYACDQVAWTAGETVFYMRGGISRMTGRQSGLELNSIIAIKGAPKHFKYRSMVPPLNNEQLFRRDRHICLYCGDRFSDRNLTRDHIIPVSRGGADEWMNVVTACQACNSKKGAYELHEIGMQLLALPYEPNYAEGLILANKRITADQMAFLEMRVKDNAARKERDMLLQG